jgi:hypothetical protein
MSRSTKITAPAAAACALVVAVSPTTADAKNKIDCTKYEVDITTSSSSDSAVSGKANTIMAKGEASAESAKTETKKALSDEQIEKDKNLYNACLAYQDGTFTEAEWKDILKASISGTAAPAPQPAAPPPPAPQPATNTSQPTVVVVQQPASATNTAPAKTTGGGGMGKLVLWTIVGVAVVVTIILVARGANSDDDGGDAGTSATSEATI